MDDLSVDNVLTLKDEDKVVRLVHVPDSQESSWDLLDRDEVERVYTWLGRWLAQREGAGASKEGVTN